MCCWCQGDNPRQRAEAAGDEELSLYLKHQARRLEAAQIYITQERGESSEMFLILMVKFIIIIIITTLINNN